MPGLSVFRKSGKRDLRAQFGPTNMGLLQNPSVGGESPTEWLLDLGYAQTGTEHLDLRVPKP